MFILRKINKQIVAYLINGILLSKKKERIIDLFNIVDESLKKKIKQNIGNGGSEASS